jgi:methylated-DNA-[protein]-cysteine S-methyltransferase
MRSPWRIECPILRRKIIRFMLLYCIKEKSAMDKTKLWFTYHSSLGEITVASDGANITGLWFAGQKYYAEVLGTKIKAADLPVFQGATEWLNCYFAGKEPAFMPPLAMEGSDFRLSVWKILRAIPYGKLISYGDIAKKIALKTGQQKISPRAVGGAVGHNPISIMVPCHRVVGSGGSLTGYAGGIDKKIKLLNLEGVVSASNGKFFD